MAGINVQVVSPRSWRFEGDTVIVYPNGKFAMDSEGTRVWDLESQEKAAREYLDRIIRTMINQGQLSQARQELQNLVRRYGKTSAAREADDRLSNRELKPTLEVLPDGSYLL